MSRSTAGRDAWGDGDHAALRGVFAERVEVRRRGGFERREITLFLGGQVTQTVEHDEGKLGVGFQSQFRIQRVQFHFFSLVCWKKSACDSNDAVPRSRNH